MPSFDIPLDLTHAAKIVSRIQSLVSQLEQHNGVSYPETQRVLFELAELLSPYVFEENPDRAEALEVRDKAAELGRKFVDVVVQDGTGMDRLGMRVRNLFECLELGEEGFVISLRAGENPNSLQRPV